MGHANYIKCDHHMERQDRYVFQAIWKGFTVIHTAGGVDELFFHVDMQIDTFIISQRSVLHFWKIFYQKLVSKNSRFSILTGK